MKKNLDHWPMRIPFYYGWVIIGIAFVTMAIGVTARTAFSLLLPPLIDEFGWERGMVAGAFSFGFLISAAMSPLIGKLMDRYGPRPVVLMGVVAMGAGLLLAPMISKPWHLYVTLGLLVGSGANLLGFTAQSLYLPNWFTLRRGLAISVAFSGVGVGAIVLLPWMQSIIENEGWRTSCRTMGFLLIVVLGPINMFLRQRPEDLGLLPDGEPKGIATTIKKKTSNIVDHEWASIEWTLNRAIRTSRFWWIALAYFCSLFAWYAIQVHQTNYLVETGFSPLVAAWALGFVSVIAIPGQISLGMLSDRIGREWIWSAGCLGFVISYIALLALEHTQSNFLLYLMVISQGFLGYAIPSVMGPIVAEIFEGKNYGTIFGTLAVALIGGGAVGPWVTGIIFDITGSYELAFNLGIVCCIVSAAAIWIAAPRKVRLVPGMTPE